MKNLHSWGVYDAEIGAFSGGRIHCKGGGGGDTKSTNVTTNLPEYAKPYYQNMMRRAQAESLTPFESYQGQRVADFSPTQLAAQQGIEGMQTPAGMGEAANALSSLQSNLGGASYAPTTFDSGYSATTQTADTFTPATAAQYMSPYMQNVVDMQKREAIRDSDIAGLGLDYQASAAGAFGGSRHGVVEAEAARNLQQQLGDIQATGLQTSYEQAAQQFGSDRAATMTAEQQTEARRQAEASMGMEAQKATEGSRQFGAEYQQQLQNLQLKTAQAQEQVATSQQALDAARLELQNATGAEQQRQAQMNLDRAYEDFINARDTERQNLAFYSSLMRGIPVPTQEETIQYVPGASAGSQLLGAGIAGLGAYLQN